MKDLTWEQIKQKEPGTILHDAYTNGIRFIILRGPSALCAYVGVPLSHPLASFHYDDIPLECHGGLTFSGEGDKWRPKDFYWYGWDYGHAGDWCFFDKQCGSSSKQWLVGDVIQDSEGVLFEFKTLVELSEKITNKVKERK